MIEFTVLDNKLLQDGSNLCIIHTDGSFVKDLRGIGVVLVSLEQDILKDGVQLKFPTTNNEAEYKAKIFKMC